MGSQMPEPQHSLDLTAIGEGTFAHPETSIALEPGSHTDYSPSEPHKEGKPLGKLLWMCMSRLSHCSHMLLKSSRLGFS